MKSATNAWYDSSAAKIKIKMQPITICNKPLLIPLVRPRLDDVGAPFGRVFARDGAAFPRAKSFHRR
jgi:hypothetical protein